MECRYCQKAFHKGEHLRRHERSHTGLKPYSCKSCNRFFSRQDSLMRHEKLHSREATAALTPDSITSRETASKPAVPSNSFSASIAASYNSPPLSNASGQGEYHKVSTVPDQIPSQRGRSPEDHSAFLPSARPDMDLSFELMWPDSIDLYQALISKDNFPQWQMPLGTLPFSLEDAYAHTEAQLHAIGEPLQSGGNSAVYDTPSSLDDRVSTIGAIPSSGNRQAVQEVRSMVANTSAHVNAAIDSASINSVFLDECLHMFFVKFIPTFPVLHRATFVFRDCAHPLLLNAIAIGSLYLGPKASIAKGEALWKLAHTAVATSWQTMIAYRGPYDACEGVQLVITALFSQVYGTLSKNRSIRITSQATRALSFSWARRCGMFDSSTSSHHQVPLIHLPEAEKDRQWKLWVGREIQHRALLAHYMLDGLIAQMSSEPTSVRHALNPLGLPTSETAFEATTADDWIAALQFEPQQPPKLSFRSTIHSLFSPATPLPSANLSAFSLRIILEGIQSILSECSEDSEGIFGVPTKHEVRSALSRLRPAVTQSKSMSTADRLETLLRWHAVCLDALVDTSILCRYLCSRWKVEQHVWSTTAAAMPANSGATWAGTEDARRALIHAVAIQDIVETLPRGRAHAIHMPASLFAAATIYAAFALTGVVTVKLVNEVDWRMVMDDAGDGDISVWDTKRYIKGDGSYFGPTRNTVYELNSMHKLMGCLKTQWGIAHDMEAIVEQWVTLCH